jgi:hypothetical protein
VLSCRMGETVSDQRLLLGWQLLLDAFVVYTSVQLGLFDHCMMSIDCREDVMV